MEKFGIFELLDALSAFTDAAQEEKSVPPAATTPSEQDAAFAPPDYAAPQSETGTHQSALSSFLSRHEALSKKIDK